MRAGLALFFFVLFFSSALSQRVRGEARGRGVLQRIRDGVQRGAETLLGPGEERGEEKETLLERVGRGLTRIGVNAGWGRIYQLSGIPKFLRHKGVDERDVAVFGEKLREPLSSFLIDMDMTGLVLRGLTGMEAQWSEVLHNRFKHHVFDKRTSEAVKAYIGDPEVRENWITIMRKIFDHDPGLAEKATRELLKEPTLL